MSTAKFADVDAAWRHIEELSPQVRGLVESVAADSTALPALFEHLLTMLRYRAVVDDAASDPDTWQDLDFAAEAATGIFTLAAAEAGTVTDTRVGWFDGLTATGPTEYATGRTWLTAAWLAVTLRDNAMIGKLVAVPLEVMRDADSAYDAYLYPWVQTLQTFLGHREVTPEMLLAAMDGTDPDLARFTSPELMLWVVHPPMRMFYHLLRRDEEKFAIALSDAVDRHHSYWATADFDSDPAGLLALAPLALVILARSVGMSADIRSPYLPVGLLRGHRVS
ncbi:immunity 49 family protein [Nocardia sp. NPDC052254]|uniref:immunity 49 family protein n=1 Tax=Nocardia sp. NPDC052254 TaxID=3155681 RepID=UPI003414D5DC